LGFGVPDVTGDLCQGKPPDQIKSDGYHSAALACYLAHVEGRQTMRSIAAQSNLHPSTVLRRIRKIEAMRDDPLIDQYLASAWARDATQIQPTKGTSIMTFQNRNVDQEADNQSTREQDRVLRRLCETGAFLAVSKGLTKAVVMRQSGKEGQSRTAVLDASVAAALVVKDWVRCTKSGRISCYEVTPSGRAALKRKLASEAQSTARNGFAEAPSVFSEQHKDWGERVIADPQSRKPRSMRVNLRESPLTMLARKKDKDGKTFLSMELLGAGERLREDFELAQIGPRVAQNWERFLTAGGGRNFGSDMGGNSAAQNRLSAALKALGPGLGDIAMRCCCFLEGLERAEKRMGWSARSGKIVLRIALQRLSVHYRKYGTEAERKIG